MMRTAPAVSVRGSGAGPWRVVQTTCATLAGAAASGWMVHKLMPDSPFIPNGLPWVLAAAIAAAALVWRMKRPRFTHLSFDGLGWRADDLPVDVELMIDLQRAVLLRWRVDDLRPREWVLLRRSEVGSAWHALRVALHARVPQRPAPTRSSRAHRSSH